MCLINIKFCEKGEVGMDVWMYICWFIYVIIRLYVIIYIFFFLEWKLFYFEYVLNEIISSKCIECDGMGYYFVFF